MTDPRDVPELVEFAAELAAVSERAADLRAQCYAATDRESIPRRAGAMYALDNLRRSIRDVQDAVAGARAQGPLDFDCLHCDAPAGTPGRTPKGNPTKRSHSARLAAASYRLTTDR